MTTPSYTLLENVSLKTRNTFYVTAHAQLFAEVSSVEGLIQLLDSSDIQSLPWLVLGEGSNLLFTRDWPGLVISLNLRGIQILGNQGDTMVIRAEASERWHDLVQWCVERGLRGIENLALIPGTVGAAPIQNIGAYGVELSDVLHRVEVWDRKQKKRYRLTHNECAFAYRNSEFKRQPHRWIVLAVELALSRNKALALDYAGIREEMTALRIDQPDEHDIFEIICRLRRQKLPNPVVAGNAGSFFKNPVVSMEIADILKQEYSALPIYPLNENQSKLSAAWLIERCGWRGFREGDAGVSTQHALVLVNHGNASGGEIWHLAQRIQESVKQRFDVWLEPEPRII